MISKYPIHTTLSKEAMRVLERYERELGAKNIVIERALLGMDKLRYKEKINYKETGKVISRIKTGIPGFDDLIEGGMPAGFFVVVTGPPGTGKTTFSLQFLMEGVKHKEKCIYFSFEEKVEQLINQSVCYGWDIGNYIEKGYLEIFGFTMLSSEEIIEIIDIFNPKRIVLDSINIFSSNNNFRRSTEMRNILKALKDKKITSIAITEKKHGLEVKEFDEFDFMADGVLFFDKSRVHELDQHKTYFIEIQKMRITKINEMPHQFIFSENGIELTGPKLIPKKLGKNFKNLTAEKDMVATSL